MRRTQEEAMEFANKYIELCNEYDFIIAPCAGIGLTGMFNTDSEDKEILDRKKMELESVLLSAQVWDERNKLLDD